MKALKVLWNGRISTDRVIWRYAPDHSVRLSKELEARVPSVWNETKLQRPHVYDGRLLVLERMREGSDGLVLDVTDVSFSRVLTLSQHQLGLKGLGVLGVQAIILSGDGTHVLVGQRASDSMYCPGYWSTPGGMLEASDAAGSFDKACMREILEEAEVNLNPARYIVALTKETHGQMGSVLIILATVESRINPNEPVTGNEEWVSRQLRWSHVEDVARISPDRSLEGIQFLSLELKRKVSILPV